jgi:hypothetical protein
MAWLSAKAKDARSLSKEEEDYLDRELAIKLRERMEHEASVRWWQLFGLEGHCCEVDADVGSFAQFFRVLSQLVVHDRPPNLGKPQPNQIRDGEKL